MDQLTPQQHRELIKSQIAGSYQPLEKAQDIDLEKGGEGSKGGKVIGHTKSGKPIYDTANHSEYQKFTSKDHIDAARLKDKLLTKRHFGDKLKEAGGVMYLPTEEERVAAMKDKKEHVYSHLNAAEKIEPGSALDRHGYYKI